TPFLHGLTNNTLRFEFRLRIQAAPFGIRFQRPVLSDRLPMAQRCVQHTERTDIHELPYAVLQYTFDHVACAGVSTALEIGRTRTTVGRGSDVIDEFRARHGTIHGGGIAKI